MKIRLINPPQKLSKKDIPLVSPPLGIMYMAAILEKQGHEVFIDDFLVQDKLHLNKGHLGLSWEEIRNHIKKNKADIMGVTNLFSSQLDYALKLCKLIKEVDKNIKTVIGGPHASVFPKTLLKNNFIDYVVVGEGEYALEDIVNNNKKIIKPKPIEDLDKLPLPAYHLINLENYFKIYKEGYESRPDCPSDPRVISMITSRGCPFSCIFCSIHPHMGKKFRSHSVGYVVNHIKFLKDNYNIKHIHFEDDNLTLNVQRFEELLDQLKNLNITWDTPNGVRADRLNFKLLKKAKESGCTRLKIAAESGDQEVVNKLIKKNLDLKEIVNVARICKKLKIPLGCFFIYGIPGEKLENIDRTFNFAYNLFKKYDALPHLNLIRPSVGTELYKISKEKNYIKKPSSKYIQYDNTYIETEDFNLKQLKTKSNKFYRKIFLLFFWKLISRPSFAYNFFKSQGLKNLFKKALAYIY